jgi:hypothetical protein
MKLHGTGKILVWIALTPLFTAGLALAAPPTALPTTWAAHDLNIDLHNLPQRYSCDDLRQKFHDVLLVLGARPDLKVSAARCELGSRSPSVRLQFSLPGPGERPAKPAAAHDAATTIVRLEPGHPGSLSAVDCELMRQIKDRLLAPLSQRVVSFNLACSAPPSKGARFNLAVQMLQPLGDDTRVADDREQRLRLSR